ncbi:MAG: histidine phosphatase family protein [Muribaculaceae bacterium]|nr:histidine phosphatase family protein [Muribaculaceae bacterium]
MKKLFSLLLTLAFAAIGFAAPRYNELPSILDGSMSLYDFSAVEPSALPDSLAPVYVDYVARHGARFLTSENKVTACEKALKKASERGSLTKAGKSFMELLQGVRKHTDGQWGMLSPIGKEQELRLGKEMAEMYPQIFGASGASVASVASYVPRVVETMDQFTIAIADTYEGIDTKAASGKAYDHLTRFFVTDKRYDDWRKEGEWKNVYDSFVDRHVSVEPALRLVGKNSGMSDKELRRLTYDMYKVLQGMRAASLPAPTDEWMTMEEYRACWEATNLEKYFQYSISPLSDIPAQGASYLLYSWLDTMAHLEVGQLSPGLSGVFGHAETLLPFFALLGIEETIARPADYDQLSTEWSDAYLTPLAANIAVIYSRGPSGALYASMRLNGRNISPVNDSRLIVPAAELRSFWLARLLRFSLGD